MSSQDGELRGSAPVLTTKDIVLELYHDMKVVRPAVERLEAAGIITRVELLEQRERDRISLEKGASDARAHIFRMTNKGLALIMGVVAIFVPLVTTVILRLILPPS